jgi:rhodanese-related sulfurtransferase
MQEISPTELAEWLQDAGRPAPVLLDVREEQEFRYCAIAGSITIPMASITARQQELDPDAETVVICHHGMRSMQVAMFLQRQGFTRICNLSGGVARWATDVDPAMPRY